jgi:hypothetical protein
LAPGEPGAVDRLALLEYLSARGATLEQMVEAHNLGNLPGVAGDLVMSPDRSDISVGEIAAGARVSEERVHRVLLAAGFSAAPTGPSFHGTGRRAEAPLTLCGRLGRCTGFDVRIPSTAWLPSSSTSWLSVEG